MFRDKNLNSKRLTLLRMSADLLRNLDGAEV